MPADRDTTDHGFEPTAQAAMLQRPLLLITQSREAITQSRALIYRSRLRIIETERASTNKGA